MGTLRGKSSACLEHETYPALFFLIKSKGVSLLFDGEMELERRVQWRCRPEGKQTVLC